MATLAFQDTFAGATPGVLAGRVSTSGHTWADVGAGGTNTQADPMAIDSLPSITQTSALTDGASAIVTGWTPPSSAYGFGAHVKYLSGSTQLGPAVRVAIGAGDTLTGYSFHVDTATGEYAIVRCVAGVYVRLAGVSHTFSAGEEHFLYLLGAPDGSGGVSLTGYVDGTQVLTYDDTSGSAITATGTIGLRGYSPSSTTTTGIHLLYCQTDPQAATLTPPSPAYGPPSVASGNFTLQLEVPSILGTSVSPSGGGSGATFAPSGPTIAGATATAPGASSCTFTYTSGSGTTGAQSISVSTSNPTTTVSGSPATYTVTGAAATAYAVSMPSSWIAGVPAPILLTPNGTVSATDTLTPSDGGAGGTFVPSHPTVAAGDTAAIAIEYVNNTPGTPAISFSSSRGLAFSPSSTSLPLAAGVVVDSWQDFGAANTGAAASATVSPRVWNGVGFTTPATGQYAGGPVVEDPLVPGTYVCRVGVIKSLVAPGKTIPAAWSITVSGSTITQTDWTPASPSAVLSRGLTPAQALDQIAGAASGVLSGVPATVQAPVPATLTFNGGTLAMGTDGQGNRTSVTDNPILA